MTPDHTLRLTTLIRAMQDVVLPAIDPRNRLAQDQASIVVGNLKLLLDQCDKAYQYEWTELREYFDLVRALTDTLQGGAATAAARTDAQRVLAANGKLVALAVPTQAQLAARVRELKQTADDLLRAAYEDGEPSARAAADQLVHAQAGRQLTRERVWFRKAGFELDATRLPSMEDVLSLKASADPL